MCAVTRSLPNLYRSFLNSHSYWIVKRQLGEIINIESMRPNICAEVILQCYHLCVIRDKINIFFQTLQLFEYMCTLRRH